MEVRKKEDLAALLVWPVVASGLSLTLSVDYLGLIVLFLMAPSLYLTVRIPRKAEKAAMFAAVVSVPGTIIVDSLMHATGAYIIKTTVFPFRVFGLFPVESFVWAFFSVYLPIMFYEYFLHEHVVGHIWESRMRYLVPSLLLAAILVTAFLLTSQRPVQVPYIYVILGTVMGLLPVVIEVLEFPSTARRIAEAGAYFFFFTFIHEITALKLGIWEFVGGHTSFIGWVSVLGVTLPVEEVLFYFILGSMAAIVYYDLWDDYPNH